MVWSTSGTEPRATDARNTLETHLKGAGHGYRLMDGSVWSIITSCTHDEYTENFKPHEIKLSPSHEENKQQPSFKHKQVRECTFIRLDSMNI